MKPELDRIDMNYIDRLRAEAELARAEALVEAFSRSGSALKRWSRSLVDAVKRLRRRTVSPATSS